MENIYWKKTVGTLISSIWLYTLAGIAASITGVVNAFLNPSGMMGMIMNMMNGDNPQPISMGDIVEKTFSLLVLVGYYLFFRSLTRFMRLQGAAHDREDIARVRTGYILMVIALFTGFIPMIGGLISFILIIVSYSKMLSGYSGLKRSETFPPEAREGASMLFSCTIWILVGCVVGIIPLIGSVIEGIILLVTFFMILDGWARIKNAAPNLAPEEEAALIREEPPHYKQVLGDGLIAIFLTYLLAIVLAYATWGIPSFYYTYYDNPFFLLLHIISLDCPSIVLITIYFWLLLSSSAQLKKLGKAGLILLIVGIVISKYAVFRRLTDFGGMSDLQVILDMALNFSTIVGMILFVWGSYASLAIKITASLLPLISMLYWRFGLSVVGSYADAEVHQQAYIVDLTIKIIFFILICIFVHKWRQVTVKPIVLPDEISASTDSDNTSENTSSRL